MMEPIRIDEVLAELARLDAEQPEGFTSRELADAMGLSLRTAGERLRVWVRAGRVEYAGDRATQTIRQRGSLTPVYRLKR